MGALSGELEEVEVTVEETPKRKPYAIWKVDGKEYKLKLSTSEIVNLESKLRVNLLTVVSNAEEGALPPLKVMLLITHGALKKFQHGIKEDDVITMFDKYCEEVEHKCHS